MRLLRRTGVVLLGLLALPVIYALTVYGLVIGAYALFGLLGLTAGLLTGEFPLSLDDAGMLLFYLLLIAVVLALCAGGLFVSWRIGRGVVRLWQLC